jgi:hypothetical protein
LDYEELCEARRREELEHEFDVLERKIKNGCLNSKNPVVNELRVECVDGEEVRDWERRQTLRKELDLANGRQVEMVKERMRGICRSRGWEEACTSEY